MLELQSAFKIRSLRKDDSSSATRGLIQQDVGPAQMPLTTWFSMRAKMTFSIWVSVALAVVWLMRFLLAR